MISSKTLTGKKSSLCICAPDRYAPLMGELFCATGFVYTVNRNRNSDKIGICFSNGPCSDPDIVFQPWSHNWPDAEDTEGWSRILDKSLEDPGLFAKGFEACTRLHAVKDTKRHHSCYAPWLANPYAESPVMNLIVSRLRTLILEQAAMQGIVPMEVPRWPKGKCWAVALTHDVDMLSQYCFSNLSTFLKVCIGGKVRGSPSIRLRRIVVNLIKAGIQLIGLACRAMTSKDHDVLWNLQEWMDFERQAGVHSSFYFSPHPDKIDRDCPYVTNSRFKLGNDWTDLRSLCSHLIKGGWEVGLHGSLQSALSAQRMQEEARLLHVLTNSASIGGRQHCLSYKAGTTGAAQAKAALLYDTSLGYNECLGFRNSAALPFYPRESGLDGPSSVLQLPLVIQDGALDAMGLNGQEAIEAVMNTLSKVKENEGCAVLLWHPGTADGTTWRKLFEIYCVIVKKIVTDETVWITTPAQMARWWQSRSMNCVYKGGEGEGD